MRFAVADLQDQGDDEIYEGGDNASKSSHIEDVPIKKHKHIHRPETEYPDSVSIDAILKAGQLPKERKRVTFPIEVFDVKKQEWASMESLETEKFSSGVFRDAFKGVTLSSNNEQQHTCCFPWQELLFCWNVREWLMNPSINVP